MYTTLNASAFHKQVLNDGAICYGSTLNEDHTLLSFADGLKPLTWQNKYTSFAYVIVDYATQNILLVRDHLGMQPLYYWFQEDKLVFAETIPDILKNLTTSAPLNNTQILNVFSDVNIYSDETIYQGVYRVEPGHMIYINAHGAIHKKAFWCLEREGDELIYQDEREYLEHFSSLMQESMKAATQGYSKIAAEFSAGLDSTAVYCAAKEAGITPKLFMHAAIPNTTADLTYDDRYEKAICSYFQIEDVQRIFADHFEPLKVFQQYANWFAGPAPHLFCMFASNIHAAVAKEQYPILLSGFGGDQGISGHAPLRFVIPHLINHGEYQKAWNEIGPKINLFKQPIKSTRKFLKFIKYASPVSHAAILQIENIIRYMENLSGKVLKKPAPTKHPYFSHYYHTLRQAEWSFLQGPFSYEVRMRIEYSAVVSKQLGFEYRYPLLYPKLLAFFLRLPVTQKRHQGIGRYLCRRYLAQYLPATILNSYQKKSALEIIPATLETFRQGLARGDYQAAFESHPYSHLGQHGYQATMATKQILAYMLSLVKNKQY